MMLFFCKALAVALFLHGAQPAQNAGVTVSGHVTAGEATRSRVMRVAFTAAGAEATTTLVDSDGSFDFSNVKPGSYTAIAFAATSVSAPMTLTVGTADITDLAIRLPDPKPIKGRITVQGNLPGSVPLPRVAFFLPPLAGIPVSSATVAVNAQPDGSFTVALPVGERQIGLASGSIPPGYKLTSFAYGTTDLLKNPLRAAATDTAELQLTFDAGGITLVKVSGRVGNLITTHGVRVVLMHPTFGSVEAPVGPDGSFLFPKVMPGSYVARLSLSGLTAGSPVTVADHDVTDVIITYPRVFIVSGHVLIEGSAADSAPALVIEAKDPKDAKPGATATATTIGNLIMLNVKDGEYNISVRSVPAGYQLKSITYGTTDLQKAPLKIDGPATWEIIVRLAASPK
jgi:hypothetical protein